MKLRIPVQLPDVGVCFPQRFGHSRLARAVGCEEGLIIALTDPLELPDTFTVPSPWLYVFPQSSVPPW